MDGPCSGGALAALLILFAVALGGCAGNPSNQSVFAGLVENFFPPKPIDMAAEFFNTYDPDQRRKAINLFANSHFGGEEPYMNVYRTMVEPGVADPDPTVRAAAIRALGRHGGPEDVRNIVLYLREKEPNFVRWEAATALQRLHHEDAVEPLMAAVRDDKDADVRAAAANALGQYPRLQVFQTLVGALIDEDYSVVTESVASLELLTGQKFGQDSARWLAWAEQTNDLFGGQRPYFYPEYVKPRGLLQKVKFWDKGDTHEPQQPAGVEG